MVDLPTPPFWLQTATKTVSFSLLFLFYIKHQLVSVFQSVMNDRTCAVIRSLLHSVRRSLLHVTSLSLIHSLLPVCSTPFVHYSSHPFTHSDSQSVSGSGTLYCTYPVVHAANKRVFFIPALCFKGGDDLCHRLSSRYI